MNRKLAALVCAALAFLPAAAAAQTAPEPTATPADAAAPSGAPDQAEGGFDMSQLTPAQREAVRLAIIKASQNPVGNITALPLQNNFNYGFGPFTRLQYNLNVQPAVPIMLSPSLNLISRTIMPIVNQPSSAPPPVCKTSFGCPSTLGISDFQEQLYVAPKTKPGQLIWGVGPILQFPTGSPSFLGTGRWSAGPNAVALVMPGKWVLGALATQLWSYAGPKSRGDVSSFLTQVFVNYNLDKGWALVTAPIVTANWTAANDKWAVPVGGGVSRTFDYGGQLMSLSATYYTFVVRPLASPQTNLRIVWTLLWPVRRGINVQDLIQEAK